MRFFRDKTDRSYTCRVFLTCGDIDGIHNIPSQFLRSLTGIQVFEGRSRMAERGGFEPPAPCGTTAFEAAPINRTLASLLNPLISLS